MARRNFYSDEDLNQTLKLNFQKLHKELLENDLSPVIGDLFSENIIDAKQLQTLESIKDPRSRTNKLLVLLHNSYHPRAFIQLRESMKNKRTKMACIVDKLDSVEMSVAPSRYAIPEPSAYVNIHKASKQEQLRQFEQLCEFIIDYLREHRVINSLVEHDLRKIQSHEDRLHQLLEVVNSSPDIREDLNAAIADEPSFSWFAEMSLETSATQRLSGYEDNRYCPYNEEQVIETQNRQGAGGPTCSEGGMQVLSLYGYQAVEDDEITFEPHEIIADVQMVDQNWWRGTTRDGQRGMFPANRVKLL